MSTWNQDSISAGSRTAGNTPISSPGLFSTRVSQQSISPRESYLHPTHLQEPKE
jgi:[calcium/calmodulin-dependent protein kinase] kinase